MTTRGDRLRAYLLAKTGGRTGWQAKLVEDSGVKRQTITKYTRPQFDRYPDLATLAALADGLGVPTFEIVAALEGESVAAADPQTRAMIRAEIEAALDARLGPPQARREARA